MRGALLILALLLLWPGPARSQEEEGGKHVRTVRISIRVEGDGRDARIEVPLVVTDAHQTVLSEQLITRGFTSQEILREGNRFAFLSYPKLTGAKRITYEFTVTTRTSRAAVTPVPVATGEPAPEDEPWLRPTLHLQSSSPLIREKLIQFALPRLEAGENDAIRLAWELTASGYVQSASGSANVLKATRTGVADARGLDRLLATFLRTSGVASRPVGGIDLGKGASKRFGHWVEARAGTRWAPLSVPHGMYGDLPWRFVRLFHGDRPMLVRSGVKAVSFKVQVTKPAAEANR